MNKAIRKVLALSLASMMLFSNLSFISASYFETVGTRSSTSNETIVEESEVEVPETSSAKTTTSKVATSKVENTKKETVFETEDATEKVTAQETDIEENAIVTVAPVDEIASETVAEEEVVIPAKPTQEEPKTASVENATAEATDKVEPQAEEVVTATKDVEEKTDVTPVETETTEATNEVETQPKEDIVVPTQPVQEEPKTTPVEDEVTKSDDEVEPQDEEVVTTTKDVEEKTDVTPVETETTEATNEVETQPKEDIVVPTQSVQVEPQAEEAEVPAVPVEEDPTETPVDDEATESIEEDPKTTTVDDEATEPADEVAPQTEDVAVPAVPVDDETTESIEEEPETTPVDAEEPEAEDEVPPQAEEVAVPAVPVEENSAETPVVDESTESFEEEPETTTVNAEATEPTEEEESQTEESEVPAVPVEEDSAETPVKDETTESFEEDPETTTVDDEEPVEEQNEVVAEPTPDASTTVETPAEESDEVENVPEVVVPETVATPEAEKQAPAEEDAADEVIIPAPEAEEPEAEEHPLAEETASAKDDASNTCPELEYAPDELTASSGPIHVVVDDEHYYEPENGEWTESKEADRNITVTYKGPYWYVTCAKFECNLSMCEGFGGAESQYISRRGGSEVTVTAPQAKDGFVFVGWEKAENDRDGYIEVYKAVYKAEERDDLSMLELNEEIPSDDLFVSSGPIHVEDCEHEKPAEGEYTAMVSGENERTIRIKYQACNGIVAAAKFKCDLPIFGGAKEVTANYRGGVEISKEAPAEFDGYVFVKWQKTAPERIPNTTNSSWEVYEAVYVQKVEVKADANVAKTLLQTTDVKVADLSSEEPIADDSQVADSTTADETPELKCDCKINGHKWSDKPGQKRRCTCPHCQDVAADKEKGKVWWDCFSADENAETNSRKGAIWWVHFTCEIAKCKGFSGQQTDTEGRRATYDYIEMTAPEANNGYEFDGWYHNGTKVTGSNNDTSVNGQKIKVGQKDMDKTFEARYKKIGQ